VAEKLRDNIIYFMVLYNVQKLYMYGSMHELGYRRNENVAVHLSSSYCLPWLWNQAYWLL